MPDVCVTLPQKKCYSQHRSWLYKYWQYVGLVGLKQSKKANIDLYKDRLVLTHSLICKLLTLSLVTKIWIRSLVFIISYCACVDSSVINTALIVCVCVCKWEWETQRREKKFVWQFNQFIDWLQQRIREGSSIAMSLGKMRLLYIFRCGDVSAWTLKHI